MSGIWTPPSVSRELEAEALRDRAEIQRAVSHLKGTLDHWNRQLREIDERLQMVWFDEGVQIMGVTPCRYHLIRWNDPPSPPSVDPIVGPEGEFREPDSGVFEQLKRGDMWSAAANHERRRHRNLAEAAADRAREREHEDHREEFRDRWNAAFRTSVSMNRASAWSQTARGRLPGKKAA